MFLFTTMAKPQPERQAHPVTNALRTASANSGIPFDYLVETARRESALKPDAKASTSSARGLFQFIEQTWLSVVRSDGAQNGLAAEAAAISGARGRLTVADPAMRQRILAMRNDPDLSARFAAALARQNHDALSAALGRKPTQGELYIAHFLGQDGATRLIRSAERTPDAAAAVQFPRAAAANRTIFHDKAGRARSSSEVYARLVRGFGPAAPAQPKTASDLQTAETEAPLATFATSGNGFHSLFTNGATRAPMAVSAGPNRADQGRPLDLAYFRRRQG